MKRRRLIVFLSVFSITAASFFALVGLLSPQASGDVGPRLAFQTPTDGHPMPMPSGLVAEAIPGEEELGPVSDDTAPVAGPTAAGADGPPGADVANVVFNRDPTFLPQNEPWVAINPTNATHIVAGANDYRRRFTPTAGAIFIIGSGAYFSTDGGQTVREGVRPAVPGVTGPVTGVLFPIDFNIPPGQGGPRAYQGAGDPSIDFDGFGNAYYSMLGFHFVSPPRFPFLFDNGVFVFRSRDGGATWSQQLKVSELTHPESLTKFEDKEFIAADKRTTGPNAGYVAVTWTRFEFTFPHGGFISARILLSISTDGGTTWGSPTEVSDSLANQFSTPFIDRQGNLFVSWADFAGANVAVKVRRAAAQGVISLGPVHTAVEISPEHFIGFGSPLPVDQMMPVAGLRTRVPRIATYPKFAIDDSNGKFAGRFYVTWDAWSSASQQLGRFQGSFWARGSDIFLLSSDDQGVTWSPTVRVNQDGPGGNDQFMPALAVDPVDGRVHVSFYDARDDPYNRLVKQVLATSTDGGSAFHETVVTVPFQNPGVAAPNSLAPGAGRSVFMPPPIAATDLTHDVIFGTRFFGDYNGLAALNGHVFVIWTDTRAIKRGPTSLVPPMRVRGPFFQEDDFLAALDIKAGSGG